MKAYVLTGLLLRITASFFVSKLNLIIETVSYFQSKINRTIFEEIPRYLLIKLNYSNF